MLSLKNPEQANITNDSLATLFRYHIQENHLPPGRTVAYGQLALLFFAAAGLLYAKPAADFADHEQLGFEKSTQATLNAIDTCYSACIVLCAATIFFYRFHIKPQQIPEELAGILQAPFSPEEYSRKNAILGGAAAFSAIPFVTIAYVAYQASLPPAAFYPLVVYIFLANTLLHFLPIKLILDDPFYGAIPRYLKAWVLNSLGVIPPQIAIQDEALSAQINALVAASNAHIATIMGCSPEEAVNQLGTLIGYSIDEFIEEAAKTPAKAGPQLSLREEQIARFIGAVLVITSCLGYLANPYLVFSQIFNAPWWAAALATALPTFFLGVLFTYFGDTMGKQIWMDTKAGTHYLYQCLTQDPENPPIFLQSIIFKLYPKAAFACMTANVFLAIFSAAAAMEMMHYAFADKITSQAMLVLYIFAQIGVSIVGVYAPLNYQKMLLTYYAVYCDKGPNHEIMKFHEGIMGLQGDLYRLKKPEINIDDFTTDIEEQAVSSTWCCSWNSKKTSAEEPLMYAKVRM